MTWLAAALSFSIGIVIGWAYTRRKVVERETARFDMLMHLGGAVDLEPCEFTQTWQEPRR